VVAGAVTPSYGPLPAVLRGLADGCGIVAALALAKLLGGTRLKVPRRAREDHPVSQACGHEALEWLVANHGGCAIDIPFGPHHQYKMLGATVALMTANGASARDIALKLGVTDRTVREWRRQLRERDAPNAGAAPKRRKP